MGELIETQSAARTVGTTVTVRELFKQMPVRRKDLERHSSGTLYEREYEREGEGVNVCSILCVFDSVRVCVRVRACVCSILCITIVM